MIANFLNQERENLLSLEIYSYSEIEKVQKNEKIFILESENTKKQSDFLFEEYDYLSIEVNGMPKEISLKDLIISVQKNFISFSNNPDLIITIKG